MLCRSNFPFLHSCALQSSVKNLKLFNGISNCSSASVILFGLLFLCSKKRPTEPDCSALSTELCYYQILVHNTSGETTATQQLDQTASCVVAAHKVMGNAFSGTKRGANSSRSKWPRCRFDSACVVSAHMKQIYWYLLNFLTICFGRSFSRHRREKACQGIQG